MTTTTHKPKRDFTSDLIDTFGKNEYRDIKGNLVEGQAISFALTSMREKGWRNLGCLNDFETLCENRHFTIIPGKNSRGQSCRIVTV